MRRLIASACLAASVAGCASFPALDSAISAETRNAPYPTLLPLGELLGTGSDTGAVTQAGTGLEARAAALRARARGLQGPVVDAASRARLAAALTRHPS